MSGTIPVFRPDWYGNLPVWHHHHSSKMRVVTPAREGTVLIRGSAAKLEIEKYSGADGYWLVRWEVIQSQIEKVNGSVVMDTVDLQASFGLTDKSGHWGEWILERFGGTCANQGKFIRYEQYLNIPGPGTGHDGDPNISIEINLEIKQAVEALVNC